MQRGGKGVVILKIKWAGKRECQSRVFTSMKDALKFAEVHDGEYESIEFEEVKVQKRRKK